MKDVAKILILGAITLAYPALNQGFSYTQQREMHPKIPPDACALFRDSFAEMLIAHNAPGGMVLLENSDCEGARYFGFSTKENDSLVERLNLLVQAVPNYKWLNRDGVVNLEPRNANAKLLDTRVVRFVYDTNASAATILSSLKNTAEFRRGMRSSNLHDGPYFGGLQSPPSSGKPVREVILQDKSVRHILNDIVHRRGRGLWVYSEQLIENSHRFTLQFVVQ